MTEKQVWLITGAGRGLGGDIAKAALAAGHAVVATARKTQSVTTALGDRDDVLAVELNVTDTVAAQAAIQAAVKRFGHLDVLVNNAGSFNAGFFEEMTPQAFRAQIETTLFGPVNITRAALPQMRAQRSGLVVTISSTAGIAAEGDFLTAYATSKFGVKGFMEALAPRSHRSASTPCSSSPASSAPRYSPRSRQTSPHPRSTTTPSAPRRPSRPGRP